MLTLQLFTQISPTGGSGPLRPFVITAAKGKIECIFSVALTDDYLPLTGMRCQATH